MDHPREELLRMNGFQLRFKEPLPASTWPHDRRAIRWPKTGERVKTMMKMMEMMEMKTRTKAGTAATDPRELRPRSSRVGTTEPT